MASWSNMQSPATIYVFCRGNKIECISEVVFWDETEKSTKCCSGEEYFGQTGCVWFYFHLVSIRMLWGGKIIESLRLEKTSSRPAVNPSPPWPLNQVPQSHTSTLLECLQQWWPYHFHEGCESAKEVHFLALARHPFPKWWTWTDRDDFWALRACGIQSMRSHCCGEMTWKPFSDFKMRYLSCTSQYHDPVIQRKNCPNSFLKHWWMYNLNLNFIKLLIWGKDKQTFGFWPHKEMGYMHKTEASDFDADVPRRNTWLTMNRDPSVISSILPVLSWHLIANVLYCRVRSPKKHLYQMSRRHKLMPYWNSQQLQI